ncbi:MAG TPA: methyltransferase domain-containing protein [bacterium]|nr:methyltransferase domain-containing protein [bacterium]HPG44483.1 methyltransferase domain-containing protein [bacterium]HPM97041.1 methyltransferase domain-containing protein [bacterium]
MDVFREQSHDPFAEQRRNWFQFSFGHDYLRIYPHRDQAEADRQVAVVWQKLELHAGQAVLDLGCGNGRHSLALSRYPVRIVGLDLSLILLAKAEEERRRHQHGCVFVNGDMRAMPFCTAFDAVVNFFTSFGYFAHEEENFAVLHSVAQVLKPGGLFWFDYLNRESVLSSLVPFDRKIWGNLQIEQRRRFDASTKRLEKEILVREGELVRKYVESVRAYDRDELFGMLQKAGFAILDVLGSYDGQPFATGSPRLIFIGQKQELAGHG